MKEKKKFRRSVPCPDYDVERIESWLADLGKEGIHLDKETTFRGGLLFTKGAPRNDRYRLEPKPKKDGQYSDRPDEEARQLCAEYGWEFVGSYSQFYIYRAIRPDAREMHTDLEVQAAALTILRKRESRQSAAQSVSALYMLLSFLKEPFRYMVTFGSSFCLLELVFIFATLITSIIRVRHIRRLQRQLKQNIPLDHSKPWQDQAWFHRLARWGGIGIYVLLLTVLFTQCAYAYSVSNQPLADFEGDPPFITIADLYPEGEYTNGNLGSFYDNFEQYSSDLGPENIQWWEYATVTTADGETSSGSLIVNYHETAAPWIAKGLVKEYLRNANKYEDIQPAPLDLGVDYAVTYDNIYETILIQHGSTVIEARISAEDSTAAWVEAWTELTVQRLT